jgi:hypothetical protein
VQAPGEGKQVVLWFEHDLYDQLQLLDVLALARESGAAAELDSAPELIVVGSFPGKPGFRGLGELRADELETLWPGRRSATPEALETAAAAWDAFRSPTPERLADVAQDDPAELPFLGAALRRLLEELPAPGDGLSTTERHALTAVAAGSRTPIAAFLAAQELEAAPYHGDTGFFSTLAALGRGRGRLLETHDGDEVPPPPPLGDGQQFVRAPLRLTKQGERVLAGDADRVDLLGLDRWVGGTHVTPEALWRWDSARRALVPPP